MSAGGTDVDASEHYHVASTEQTPSLQTVIIDTNPRAWASISQTLSQEKAVANILVFLNTHLAYSSANQFAVIASHPSRAAWLYPSPSPPPGSDVEMQDAPPTTSRSISGANKYTIFAQIETAVLASLKRLNQSSTPEDLTSPHTSMSGALTLALAYTNKANIALLTSRAGADAATSTGATSTITPHALHSRILVISVSDASPGQYISTMNAVFAAAHARVSIDVLALRGDNSQIPTALSLNPSSNGAVAPVTAATQTLPSESGRTTFLQQAADLTNGTYLSVPNPVDAAGLLSFLMFGFADAEARGALISPTQHSVDFRAACFCHRKVIATGFVCSICLSIFCSVPANPEDDTAPGNFVECLTCGSRLVLGFYGDKPAVVPRRRKKRKRAVNGSGREDSGSLAGTPRPG